MLHALGAMQSAAVWQGNAHLPYCVLQWWKPHVTSDWQGRASKPGTAIVPDAAGAAEEGGATYGGGAGEGAGGGKGAGVG
jgi:hypothetical protein